MDFDLETCFPVVVEFKCLNTRLAPLVELDLSEALDLEAESELAEICLALFGLLLVLKLEWVRVLCSRLDCD